jgi:hypothetical protein
MTPLVVEVIDGHNLSSKLITHETKALTITIGLDNSKVVFNVISSPTLSSLGYHGSFCIIVKWIGRRSVFILNQ